VIFDLANHGVEPLEKSGHGNGVLSSGPP
jgi:hypothetical protein